MTTNLAAEMPAAAPSRPPTLLKAIGCFLLNVVVFPGVGTLAGGEQKRRATGWTQVVFGLVLLPLIVVAAMGGALFSGMDIAVVQAWLTNFMLILVIWNVVTGAKMVREAWKRSKNP